MKGWWSGSSSSVSSARAVLLMLGGLIVGLLSQPVVKTVVTADWPVIESRGYTQLSSHSAPNDRGKYKICFVICFGLFRIYLFFQMLANMKVKCKKIQKVLG